MASFKKQYMSILRETLSGLTEEHLQHAYDLGREVMVNGLGVLDMEALYRQILLSALEGADTAEKRTKIIDAAFTLFRESLAPFEMAHRSFRETNDELRSLTTELEERTKAISAYAQNLEALKEIANIALSSLSLNEVSVKIAENLRETFHASVVSLLLLDENKNILIPKAYACEPPIILERISPVRLDNDNDIANVLLLGRPLIIEDTSTIDIPPATKEEFESSLNTISSILQLQLKVRGKGIGVLGIGWPKPRSLEPKEIDSFKLLADEVAIGINNANMYDIERNIADTLQLSFIVMPESISGIEFGFDFRSATEAAKIGGDFFDIFKIENDIIGIIMGDVSGKGIGATAIASVVKNTIKAYAYIYKDAASVMAKTNNLALNVTELGGFITVYFAILNTQTGELLYCSAGHPPAILKKGTGYVTLLSIESPAIGAFIGAEYEEEVLELEKGDSLILYTDGITEARCDNRFYGENRLIDFVRKAEDMHAKEIVKAIFDDVIHCSGVEINDDMAILVIKLTC